MNHQSCQSTEHIGIVESSRREYCFERLLVSFGIVVTFPVASPLNPLIEQCFCRCHDRRFVDTCIRHSVITHMLHTVSRFVVLSTYRICFLS